MAGAASGGQPEASGRACQRPSIAQAVLGLEEAEKVEKKTSGGRGPPVFFPKAFHPVVQLAHGVWMQDHPINRCKKEKRGKRMIQI